MAIFLFGLGIGLATALVVHIYHGQIKADFEKDKAALLAKVTELESKLPKI